MALIEDLRNQMDAEIRAAQKSARREERAAEAQRTKYLWSKQNPSWACEANLQIISEYLNRAGIEVSSDSLDLALRACRNNLAFRALEAPELTAEEKVRAENDRLRGLSVAELRAEVQANVKRQLAKPEWGGHGSVFVPKFSAEEFKKMSPSQVKEILQYPGSRQERPGVRAGIDKLLRDAQLLKDATN
jgi:hypothetical protein